MRCAKDRTKFIKKIFSSAFSCSVRYTIYFAIKKNVTWANKTSVLISNSPKCRFDLSTNFRGGGGSLNAGEKF